MENTEKIINFPPPEQKLLKDEYDKFTEVRYSVVNEIKEQVENVLVSLDSSPVVSGRIKNFTSYFSKYLRLLKTGIKDPKITDLLGVRIICPFIEDLQAADDIITKYFNIFEREIKGHYTYKEFGYESTHLLIRIPDSIINKHGYPGTDIAEIQIRTILQDAWAEVEHELVYKAEFSPFDEPMKRKLAAVNASLSLADIIFQEIRSYQRKFSKEMDKRRESFFQKIEESTDEILFSVESSIKQIPVNGNTSGKSSDTTADESILSGSQDDTSLFSSDYYSASIDDLLVHALTSHNQNRFNEAISQYTNILQLKPDNTILSIIYKHRGMANFACSQYNEAIEDFSSSLELDAQSYKAAYYRGVIHSVMKLYSQAIDDYTLSLSINPYQSFCLFRRGQAYYHIGDFPQALADCENSLSLEPNNKSALKFKELLLEKLRM
ncbi:MAG: tetratricopeptide repeat protein [Treponema sp.]|nr:tetratricopeptide repeat protein [Treponema sp.]